MCVLSIKVPIRKKSGNLFNDPCVCVCVCVYIYIYIYIYIYKVFAKESYWLIRENEGISLRIRDIKWIERGNS